MIRQSCGTRMGALLHIEHAEQLCGTCETGERYRSIAAEAKRPAPPDPRRLGEGDWDTLISALASLWTTPKDRI